MPTDGDIDFSRYNDYDLLAAADHIESDHFPKNYGLLNAEIDRRGIRGKDVPSPQSQQDALDTAAWRNSTSTFGQIVNGAIAGALIVMGTRGLFGDLVLTVHRGTQPQPFHIHGALAIMGGAQMLLGGGLLVASLLVYALDGHRYTQQYMRLARFGRLLGIPLLLGGALLGFV